MTPELGLRERKKQRTRALIADTARRLFLERGFDAVTVAEVARAAEVAEKTVFNYFPAKEDLVYWQLESFEDELLEAIRERSSGESVLAAFGRFVLVRRGLLTEQDPEAAKRLAALTRMLTRPVPARTTSSPGSPPTRSWASTGPSLITPACWSWPGHATRASPATCVHKARGRSRRWNAGWGAMQSSERSTSKERRCPSPDR